MLLLRAQEHLPFILTHALRYSWYRIVDSKRELQKPTKERRPMMSQGETNTRITRELWQCHRVG